MTHIKDLFEEYAQTIPVREYTDWYNNDDREVWQKMSNDFLDWCEENDKGDDEEEVLFEILNQYSLGDEDAQAVE